MGWVPESAWLTKLRVDSSASDLAFDLAIDASGANNPSRAAAGLDLSGLSDDGGASTAWSFSILAAAVIAMIVMARRFGTVRS